MKLPPTDSHLLLSTPADKVLLITLNRPPVNAMNTELESDLEKVINWFETEPSLWVLIITGNGKAFCAGQDLKVWLSRRSGGSQEDNNPNASLLSRLNGFGSVSRRRFQKPVIAAVNGLALGGGCEMVVNCDVVIAAQSSKFGFPEVKRGVYAAQGGVFRLQTLCGHIKASELLLTGRIITAQEAKDEFNMINKIVSDKDLLSSAIEKAVEITRASPDSVRATKAALEEQRYLGESGIENVYKKVAKSAELEALYLPNGNIDEGLRAFKEKRNPVWKNPTPLRQSAAHTLSKL